MRTFQQDKLTKANFLGFCAQAIVAITMAANGAGPYSFVVGMLAGSLVTGILVFIWARCRSGSASTARSPRNCCASASRWRPASASRRCS
jgi:O-antigen/teichoic acid export membrane protein